MSRRKYIQHDANTTKSLQVNPGGETFMLKENSTDIRFDQKIANNGGEGYLLTTNFYKSTNDAFILAPPEVETRRKVSQQLEGTSAKKQENMTTK